MVECSCLRSSPFYSFLVFLKRATSALSLGKMGWRWGAGEAWQSLSDETIAVSQLT